MFLDGVAAKAVEVKDEAETRRVLRNLVEVYSTKDIAVVKEKIAALDLYFKQQYPGKISGRRSTARECCESGR